MRRILMVLVVLALTQDAYGMENEQTMLRVTKIKEQLITFDNEPLEKQQQLLIDGLNCWRAAKREAEFPIWVKLMSPLPEYEGFNQTEQSFTLNTFIKYSDANLAIERNLPIKEIDLKSMKSLIKFSINKSEVYALKAKMPNRVRDASISTNFEESLMDARHELLSSIYKLKEKYNKYKIAFKAYAMNRLTLIPGSEILKFQLPRKSFVKNEGKYIKDVLQLSPLLRLGCRKRSEIQNQNKFCNEKCTLTAYTQFSNEDLFNFFKTRIAKYDELVKLYSYFNNQTITYQVFPLIPLQPDPLPQQRTSALPLFVIAPKLSDTQIKQNYMRQKLEDKRQKQNAVKNEEIQKQPSVITKQEPLIFQEETKPKFKNKKNRQPQQQKNSPSQKKNENVNNINPQRTTSEKASITPSKIITNVQGAVAAIGATQPDDGRGGFIPANSKKVRKTDEYGACQINKGPLPRRNLQTNVTQILQPNSPVKLPEVTVPTPSRPMTKDVTYSNVMQNRILPETQQINVIPENKSTPPNKGIYNPSAEPSIELIDKKKRRAFLTNPAIDLVQEKEESLSQHSIETKEKLDVAEEPKAQNKPVCIEPSTFPIHKQPYPAVFYDSDTFIVTNHPTIEKIIIQGNNKHTYEHGNQEITDKLEKILAEVEVEKRLRKEAERELKDLKQKLAQLEMVKK
ncbi:MAG: hypothetical protein H0X26_05705 [Alphaproteobacteria bacterium]|nr:hypothetical protein [Alphaproteobacteria bacterium]